MLALLIVYHIQLAILTGDGFASHLCSMFAQAGRESMAILNSVVQPSDHLRIQSHARETSNKDIKRKNKLKEFPRTSQLSLWCALLAMQYFSALVN